MTGGCCERLPDLRLAADDRLAAAPGEFRQRPGVDAGGVHADARLGCAYPT